MHEPLAPALSPFGRERELFPFGAGVKLHPLRLGGRPGGFDQFPKLWIFLKCFVLAGFQAGTEQEIVERVAAENAVDEHAQFVPFKIDAIITHAKTVQRPPAQFQFAERIQFGAEGLLGETAEFAEDLQLQFLGHARHFSGAGWSKDDLEHILVEGCLLVEG